MNRPEIALLGGSFNPPHVAHLMAAYWALATQGVAEVWLLPSFKHPFGKKLAPYEDRVEMCRLAAKALQGVSVSTVEQDLAADPLCGKTVRTLEHLREKHVDRRFALIVGTDILPETPKWYRWERVQDLARIIVIGREGYPSDVSGDAPHLPAISSTDIREKLARGAEVGAVVPRAVLGYIREKGLYSEATRS